MSVISHCGIDYGIPTVEIQDDASATSFDATKVPTGQTIENVLNSNFPNFTLVQTVTLTGCASGSFFKLYKAGKIIYFECTLTLSSGVAGNATSGTLGTVNEEYRPKKSFNMGVPNINGGKYYSGTLYITASNGAITLSNDTSGITTIFYTGGTGFYLID